MSWYSNLQSVHSETSLHQPFTTDILTQSKLSLYQPFTTDILTQSNRPWLLKINLIKNEIKSIVTWWKQLKFWLKSSLLYREIKVRWVKLHYNHFFFIQCTFYYSWPDQRNDGKSRFHFEVQKWHTMSNQLHFHRMKFCCNFMTHPNGRKNWSKKSYKMHKLYVLLQQHLTFSYSNLNLNFLTLNENTIFFYLWPATSCSNAHISCELKSLWFYRPLSFQPILAMSHQQK